MTPISMSTEVVPHADSSNFWREAICKVIHRVEVRKLAPRDFAARISGRDYGTVSSASFWSKPHQVYSRREQIGNAGGAGYLLSLQIEGDAYIEQEDARLHVRPGCVAIVDARRPMSITFPGDVRRIVAKLPAGSMEKRLPVLGRRHSLSFLPQRFLAQTLHSYLTELSDEAAEFSSPDAELLAENISNLLHIALEPAGLDRLDSSRLREHTLRQYLRRHACDARLTLDMAAAHFRISRRLLQKMLQEMETSFTEIVIAERLERAAVLLGSSRAAVSQVAYRCGFNDVSHFNHLFKRTYGMSPSAYRVSTVSPTL